MARGVTQDRLHRLKRDIPTRWHSRLGTMLTYITEVNNIAAICNELDLSSDDVPQMKDVQKNTFAEIIYVLAEVRRVARLLEADRKVAMSRSPLSAARSVRDFACHRGYDACKHYFIQRFKSRRTEPEFSR